MKSYGQFLWVENKGRKFSLLGMLENDTRIRQNCMRSFTKIIISAGLKYRVFVIWLASIMVYPVASIVRLMHIHAVAYNNNYKCLNLAFVCVLEGYFITS